MEHLIEIRDLRKIYALGEEPVAALDGVSLTIEKGEFVAIMGASGSGKSTMLNILGCLDTPTSGSYLLDGIEVARRSRSELARIRNQKLGFVFQNFNLLARTTAIENVELPDFYLGRLGRSARRARARMLLERVGLGGRGTHTPAQLSGGQQQRVAIARALMNEPPVLFADEPTGNLDTKSSIEIMNLFTELSNEGITIVMVTHEDDIAAYAKRHLLMREAVRAIWRNKTRSALTMLGIIFGIAAVIVVLAIGRGASLNMVAEISKMGNNMVMIFSEQRHAAAGVRGAAGEGQSLTASDGLAIRRELSHLVQAVTPEVRTQMQVVYAEKNWSTTVYGCSTEFSTIRNWDVVEGSFFDELEEKQCARVCLIGRTVATNLFPNDDPVGRTIRIGNMPFKVKGVMGVKGVGGFGQDQDDVVLAPYTTVKRVLQASKFPDNVRHIKLSLYSMDQLDEAKREIGLLLRQRHRLADSDDDDFRIIDMAEITSTMSAVSSTMTVLLAAVAAISLLVGGIGIMNIMLVSVTERIREIGLRMAIGATPANILGQFILEAVVLSTLGGALGVALGVAGAQTIGNLQGWPILVEPSSAIGAFLFSAFVGMFFGFYPAWRASRLNPIDCLRYE